MTLFPYMGQPTCPREPHRGPEGPNENIAQCRLCGMPEFSMRPAGETFGEHLADCSLSVDHPSWCQPDGSGHPPSKLVRG